MRVRLRSGWEMPAPGKTEWATVLESEEEGWGTWEDLSFSQVEVLFLSSAPPGRAGRFTWPCMVRPGLSYSILEKYFQVSVQLRVHFEKSPLHKRWFFVCTEPVSGVVDLLNSSRRMWVLCHHWFIVLGHIQCSCCAALLLSNLLGFALSKAAFSSNL